MQTSSPIAIVGMSALFAGSEDLLGFWRDVVSATDRLTDVPPHHWLIEDYYHPDRTAPDMTYAKRGGFLRGVPFDAAEFGIPPNAIPATDSAQLLALIAAKRVLADAARFRDGDANHSRTSVILGVASATELVVQMGSRLQHPIWRKALRDAGLPESKVQEVVKRIGDHYQPWQESSFPGLLGNVVAGRIANRLDLGGSNFVTDAACASSMSALQAGLSELYLGDSDMVIAGGVDALNDILMFMCFSKTPAFSPTGDCRPFAEDADGTLIGEGVGMLALRRLEDAERDGDPIYAVIRGLGASSDGRGSSVYAPRPEGQAKALARAYDRAGYSPATVELVEAHGTGTKAGDAAEARGLTSVFGPANPEGRAWCALGSVKSQIGHTKAAAGSAGLIKVALALHHKVLPPTLKVQRPNAQLGLDDGPLYINTIARPWVRSSEHPRRGSVSSFGFGGSNFHVTIEEYTGPGRHAERLRAWSEELIVLSGASRSTVGRALRAVAKRAAAGEAIARIAAELAEQFDASADVRLALVVADAAELDEKARRAAAALEQGTIEQLADPDVLCGTGDPGAGKTAFLFPGQGSQYVGMGAAAAMTFESARDVWDRAADLPEFGACPLDRAVFPPPAFSDEERARQQQTLTAMETAQPAIAAVSLGYLSLLRSVGLRPDVVAGHSFGELTALATAGRLQEEVLLTAAKQRGELMAAAAATQPGAMIAVRADAATVSAALGSDADVVIANDNAPTEVVLAGATEAIEAAQATLSQRGLTAIRLPVASAFHSSIVAASCEPFHAFLGTLDWRAGTIPVFANTTGKPYPKAAGKARQLLADQLAAPVRFRAMIDAMARDGVTRFVEVGPGNVLTKLVGRCLGDRPHTAVALDDKRQGGLRALWRGLGRLCVEGVALDLTALGAGYRVPPAPAKAKPHQILVTGANHQKPYPPANGAAGIPGPNPEMPAPVPPPTARPLPSTTAPSTTAPSTAAPPTAAPPTAASRPAHALPTPSSLMPPSTPSRVDSGALTDIHHVTIDAHRRYQELMAESHRTFLEMASGVLGQMAGAPPQPIAGPAATPSPTVPAPAPYVPQPPAVPATQAPVAPAPVTQATVTQALATAPVPAPVDTTALALQVVAEKTGYPLELLDLDMEMEAGLGIDSIKQVEILSELQARVPGMPEIEPAELASLRTLRDVADKLQPAGNGAGQGQHAPAAAAVDTTALALQVVAEKTGYPLELLDLDMEMEAGLGIDSIKQVEILSELQARVPGMPEIEPAELANLRTLRDVADKLQPAGNGAGQRQHAPPAAAVDTTALALEVVAEKTGYPLELLDLDMEMEAGLGIDSIKQVEILSELQARVPGMPEIEPAELANLRTLRDVADKLQPAGNGAATTKRPAAVDATVDTTALALEVVAEKTGYPLELLDLDMEMEAGLGIDSIKQVEILSELQARVPGMPEIEPAELANLRTLRDVADKLRPAAAVVIPTPPAPAAPAEVEGATDVTAFVPTFTAELRPGFGLAALQHDATVQVTNELPELARQIATGLRARGVPAEVVDEVSETSAVISLAGLAVADGTPDAETATAVHTRVMQAAGLVAQHSEPTERLLVTIQSTGGDFGLHADPGPAAWLGGLPGVVKTAAREWPGASLKAIDVEVPETAAAEILDELFCGGPALEVGISTARGRGVVRMEPLRRNDTDGPALAPGAVVVVSGGARGVTASSVARLAEAWNLRLALLGRSELGDWPDGVPLTTDAVQLTGALAAAAKRRGDAPDLADLQRQARALAAGAEVRQSLATLESRGIETLYLSADVADAAQLGRALDRVRDTWGPIAGIVHGAGVLRDKSIADLTPDRIREVFAPKVAGLAALLDATRDDPIELIALFSSIAARAGNAGQAAYAAANEVLNKVAATEAARRGPGCRVRSYNWGPWAGGMVDAALAAHFERQGIDLLSIEAGTDYFVADLGRGGDGVERVVLAAPSFPCGTHRLTVAANASSDSSAAREEQMEPAFVADLALRLGQALKPVHAMRAYLEDFVIGPLVPAAVAAAGGVAIVDVAPVDSGAPGYRMVFRDANGNAHSETLVRYSELGATPPPSQPSGDLEPWPIEASAAYETVLRREPGFQAIEALEGVSEEGGRALLRSGKSLGWPQRAFARGFDPAAFDGLLQLGALWTHHKAGAVQTMARMRSVVVHHLETIPERLRSAFSARRTATGTLFDFFLATEDGDLVAELRGVEFATPVA